MGLRNANAAKLIFVSVALATAAPAADLTIHLPDSVSVSRKTVTYQCGAEGAKIGVPPKPFSVEYINWGGNNIVVVPIQGNSLIFSSVTAASGVRYTAQTFTWWDAGGQVSLSSDSATGKLQATCRKSAK